MDIKVIGLEALRDGFSYLAQNPSLLLRGAMNAARLRLGVPVSALRWLVAHLVVSPKAPKDIDLAASAPALSVGATVDLMGTPLKVRARLYFEALRVEGEQLRLELRVRDLSVKAPPGTPAEQMLLAMDLTKPGNLVMFMPKRPATLIEANEDRFVFDLMKIRKIERNGALRQALISLSQAISVREIGVEDDLLVLGFKVRPKGVRGAVAGLRHAYNL